MVAKLFLNSGVQDSNVEPEAGYPAWHFSGVSQPLQTNAGTVPQIELKRLRFHSEF
jgi:hypothetical protein